MIAYRKPSSLARAYVIARDLDRTLIIGYVDASGSVSCRVVDPHKLSDTHLDAWCCHRQEFRRFVRSRVLAFALGPHPNLVHLPLNEPEVIS